VNRKNSNAAATVVVLVKNAGAIAKADELVDGEMVIE